MSTSELSPVRSTLHHGIALLRIDNPPVNALSTRLRHGLATALTQAGTDPDVVAVVLICEGKTFVAGADIKEFDLAGKRLPSPDVVALVDASAKPVIAAIHGHALGGGLELALACHWRVALSGTSFGLPEITLGLIPGGGGTQRLPRLIGLEAAARMILSGLPIDADAAKSAGMVDAVWEDRLEERAIEFASAVAHMPAGTRQASQLPPPPMDAGTEALLQGIAKDSQAAQRAPTARNAAIQALLASAGADFHHGRDTERTLFLELLGGRESRALRALFLAERAAKRDRTSGAPVEPIAVHDVAIIGAGTMGRGIAIACADAGFRVTMIDTDAGNLDRGIEAVEQHYLSLCKRGRIDDAAARDAITRIAPSGQLGAAGRADLIIEAAFEDLSIKQAVFRELDAIARPGAILATNTSTLDVNAIAAATRRPDAVVGMHFFSPANIMRLLEVVRGDKTSPQALAAALATGHRLRKVCVTVGVCDGFVANRISAHRARQIELLLQTGALPQQIDEAARQFGFSMGPCAATDLAGLDVSWRIRRGKALRSPIADALCEHGRYGQKAGRGYYAYAPGSRVPEPDPDTEAIIKGISDSLGITRRAIDIATITDRLILPIINEGARVLEDGIAQRASDVDLVWVYGFGWPARRGGPMFHAEQEGLASICEKLNRLAAALDDPSLVPAPLLRDLAARGLGFSSLQTQPQA